MKTNDKSTKIIKSLLEDGYDWIQIAESMIDVEWLELEGIDQETAEEIYDICKEWIQL